MTTIKKTYRVDEETDRKIKELLRYFDLKSENEMFKRLINYIYDIKDKKLVPVEELEKKEKEIKDLYYKIGKLESELEKEKRRGLKGLFGG